MKRAILRLALLVIATAGTASAAEVRGTMTTLLSAREAVRGEDVVSIIPLYELVALEVTDLKVPGAASSRLVLNGWGRLEFGHDGGLNPEDPGLTPTTADLGLFFLETRFGSTTLRLGRQHIAQGVGRMQMIDGLNVESYLPAGLVAQAFYGMTVQPELRVETDYSLGGARIAKRLPGMGEVGLAGAVRWYKGELYRADVGLDGFYDIGPTHWVGLVVASPAEEGVLLTEARLATTFTKFEQALVTLDGERVAPNLLLNQQSIFSVFADGPYDAFGGDIAIKPSPYYDLNLEGHLLRRNNASLGYRATFQANAYREASHRSRVGAEVRRLDEDQGSYTRARLLTSLQLLEPLRLAGDVFVYRFDEPVNDYQNSYIGQLSAVYDLTRSMRVVASVAGGSTPFAKSQVEGMLRFAYGYNVDFDREVAP